MKVVLSVVCVALCFLASASGNQQERRGNSPNGLFYCYDWINNVPVASDDEYNLARFWSGAQDGPAITQEDSTPPTNGTEWTYGAHCNCFDVWDLYQDGDDWPSPTVNGWEIDGEANITFTCGGDNETFVHGPLRHMGADDTEWTFTRYVYIPKTTHYARVVDYYTNMGSASQDLDFQWSGYSYSDAGVDNEYPKLVNPYYLVWSDSTNTATNAVPIEELVGVYHIGGEGARYTGTLHFSYIGDQVMADFGPVTVSAGDTVGFMTVLSNDYNLNKALASRDFIQTNPASLYNHLTFDQISNILNWDACASAYADDVTTSITQTSDNCGSQATYNISVSVSAGMPSDRTFRLVDANGDAGSSFTATTFSVVAGTYTLETWIGGCIMERTEVTAVASEMSLAITVDSNSDVVISVVGGNAPYTWSNGATGTSVSDYSSTISVTDANSCTFVVGVNSGSVLGGVFSPVVHLVVLLFALFFLF